MPKNNYFLIAFSLFLLVFSLCFFSYSRFDLELQNYLFDFKNKSWLVDENEPIKKFFFYNLPKILFGLVALITMMAAYFGFSKKNYFKSQKLKNFLQINCHQFLLITLGLILIPSIAGNIKKFTNIYCPKQLEIYDGSNPYIRIFESYPESFKQVRKGKCFPAGHCIAGFAFFILFFALKNRAQKICSLIFTITYGWILGFYQMAKGAHFFGDTFISMLLCFMLACLIAIIYQKFHKYDGSTNY
jgi:membrane-associated PAP2 superfamily phosphatase